MLGAAARRFVLGLSMLGLCMLGSACSGRPYFIGEHREPGECEAALAGALLCSGFEAEDLLSEWDEIETVMTGEVARTTERTHTGQAALRATSADPESVAVVTAELEPVRSGTLYLRAHLFVPAGVPTETINIMFIGADPAPDPFVGVDINLEGGALQVFSPQANPSRQTGTLTIPRDRWFCLRAEIAVSEQGSVQLFADDALALEATDVNTLPEAGIGLLRAGVDWSSAQEDTFEIFLDDLVLDRAPVACATATAEAER